MIGVKFDNIHSCNDLGVTLSAFSITPPEPKTYSVNIPGADGEIDLTSELGDIKYKNRILTLTFEVLGNSQHILNKYSDVMNAIHGRKFEKIVIEEDENYYYGMLISLVDDVVYLSEGEYTAKELIKKLNENAIIP